MTAKASIVFSIALAAGSGCASDDGATRVDPAAHVVELPGAMREVDFDDIVYSERLNRVLVPARRSGLYLIDPATGEAKRLGHLRAADSADEGGGLIFVIEREAQTLDVVDAESGQVLSRVATGWPADYVRHVASRRELWVTEPAASPPGIEVFTVPKDPRLAPRRSGFVSVDGGPEGLEVTRRMAYTHAASDVVAIDLATRSVSARWATGCDGTHGFPRVDEVDALLIASCAGEGEVVLLDLEDGREIDRYAVDGGEALPGYSPRANHLYVRSDPGSRLATVKATRGGLRRVEEVDVPEDGHCLTADTVGHYWTCDANEGRVLRFDDP